MKQVLAKFITSSASVDAFPPEGPPEFAFLGRSNVGKSSLVNSLLGYKLAHVSSTPGRTRTINFIGIFGKSNRVIPDLMMVDLPGYGYAKLSRKVTSEWPRFIAPYLMDRRSLRLAIVLVDANVPPQVSDRHLIDFLRSAERDLMIVATKADKLSGNRLRDALTTLRLDHGVDGILPYSSKTGAGRSELWRAIQARAAK